MAGAIRALLGDPERRLRMSEAARREARAYEPDTVAPEYDRLFAAVLENASPARRPSARA
jgi:glycosyltransferase involved in cell wall biosynthesis